MTAPDAHDPAPTFLLPDEAAAELGVTAAQFAKIAAEHPMLEPMTWQGGPAECYDTTALQHVKAERAQAS